MFPAVGGAKIFGKVSTTFALAWLPIILKLFSVLPVAYEPIIHLRGVGGFWLYFFVTDPKAVVLSVWIGIGECGWPISFRSRRTGMANLEFTKSASMLASAADVISNVSDHLRNVVTFCEDQSTLNSIVYVTTDTGFQVLRRN